MRLPPFLGRAGAAFFWPHSFARLQRSAHEPLRIPPTEVDIYLLPLTKDRPPTGGLSQGADGKPIL